jgi:hypothetical protein
VNVPYLNNPVKTVTSSNTPLNSGVTRRVYGGGGFRAWSGPLIASDNTSWYFGAPQIQDMLIEDGIDLDNDGDMFGTGPLDIPIFSLLTFSVGTSSVTRSGDEFVLTMHLDGLYFDCVHCNNPPVALDSYFGLPSSTTWTGLLTLTFINQASAVDFDAGWGGPATGQIVYTAATVPEPTSIFLLATVVIGVGFAAKRKFSGGVRSESRRV